MKATTYDQTKQWLASLKRQTWYTIPTLSHAYWIAQLMDKRVGYPVVELDLSEDLKRVRVRNLV